MQLQQIEQVAQADVRDIVMDLAILLAQDALEVHLEQQVLQKVPVAAQVIVVVKALPLAPPQEVMVLVPAQVIAVVKVALPVLQQELMVLAPELLVLLRVLVLVLPNLVAEDLLLVQLRVLMVPIAEQQVLLRALVLEQQAPQKALVLVLLREPMDQVQVQIQLHVDNLAEADVPVDAQNLVVANVILDVLVVPVDVPDVPVDALVALVLAIRHALAAAVTVMDGAVQLVLLVLVDAKDVAADALDVITIVLVAVPVLVLTAQVYVPVLAMDVEALVMDAVPLVMDVLDAAHLVEDV